MVSPALALPPISLRVNQTLHLPPQHSALWVERGRSVPTVACHSSQNVLWWPALKMASAAVVSAGFLPVLTTHLQPPSEWKEEGCRGDSHSILGHLGCDQCLGSLKRPSEPIPLDMNPQKVHYRKANPPDHQRRGKVRVLAGTALETQRDGEVTSGPSQTLGDPPYLGIWFTGPSSSDGSFLHPFGDKKIRWGAWEGRLL